MMVFEDNFREHLHDKISTVTFCNANNKAFVSNPGPSNLPMFVTFTKNIIITKQLLCEEERLDRQLPNVHFS